MDQWVVVPEDPRDGCHRSGAQEEAHGPFLREEFWFRRDPGLDPRFDRDADRAVRLFTSAVTLRDMLSLPGSPFVPISPGELEALRVEREELQAQVEQLQARVEELAGGAASEVSGLEGLAELVAARVVEGLAGSVPTPTGDAPAAPKQSRAKRVAS